MEGVIDGAHGIGSRRASPAVRALRAFGVAAGWALFALPLLLGPPRCSFAAHLHAPCPGCGMTRAVRLMQSGDVLGSLAMHPLAFPLIAATAAFAATTVLLTWRDGTLLTLWESRAGRAALVAMLAVQAATLVLWALRWAGLFGGPVPV